MTKLHPDSIRFMERMGWTRGGGNWDHADFPFELFPAADALIKAREQFLKEC